MPERHLYSDTPPKAEEGLILSFAPPEDSWRPNFVTVGPVSDLSAFNIEARARDGWSWMPLGPIPEITRPRPKPKFAVGDRVVSANPSRGEGAVSDEAKWFRGEWTYEVAWDDGIVCARWERSLSPAPPLPAFSVGDVVGLARLPGYLGRVVEGKGVTVRWCNGQVEPNCPANALTLVTCPDGWREMGELGDGHAEKVWIAYRSGVIELVKGTTRDLDEPGDSRTEARLWWKPCEVPAHPFDDPAIRWPKP